MATPFSTIFSNFMMTIEDYTLVALYNTSVSDFETYLSGWLIPAISDFKICNQSLAYSSSSFTETLTQENINILTLLMKKNWLVKQIDDIKQMNLAVTDRDFKRFAESNNMLAKQKRLILMQEEVSQALIDYGLDDNSMWVSWIDSGVFWTPP